ncbi:MAG: hypothetical protein JKY15_06210 [Deltaproteobacteria bacterium]|nr:hypothetical protein [Deltaproteobacteria bacterium]
MIIRSASLRGKNDSTEVLKRIAIGQTADILEKIFLTAMLALLATVFI